MVVRGNRLRLNALGALAASVLVAAAASGQTREDACQELTGAERAKCEQQRVRDEQPPSEADGSEDSLEAPRARSADDKSSSSQPPSSSSTAAEEPPPDTKSESDEQSDTADPPQA